MPGSPIQAFPYPSLADPANGPVAFQALALALDPKTMQVYANTAARTAKVAAPVDGMGAYMTDAGAFDVAQGGLWYRVATPNIRANAPAMGTAPAGYPLGTSRFLALDASWPGVGVLTTMRDANDAYTSQTIAMSSGEWKRSWVAGAWTLWNVATMLTAGGTVNVVANALAPNGGATFGPNAFPVGKFTVPPLMFVTLQSATAGSNSAKVTAHAITKDQFYIGLQNANAVSAMTFAATPVAWYAIQMSPAAAGG